MKMLNICLMIYIVQYYLQYVPSGRLYTLVTETLEPYILILYLYIFRIIIHIFYRDYKTHRDYYKDTNN